MKRKVNVNREKISSEEIASQKKFSTLIKSYPTLASPIRRTTWRTKSILWVVIASALLVYYVTRENKFEGYKVNKIFTDERSLNISVDDELQKRIEEQLSSAKKTADIAKGIEIELEMVGDRDTIRIISYGGGKYFLYDNSCFKTEENLLPDSIVSQLIR